MSGTSLDGIDAALVSFSNNKPQLLHALTVPWADAEKENILSLNAQGSDEINRAAELDRLLGQHFAKASLQLLSQHNIASETICAIGSHGQTIRHYPNKELGFTVQIGDPNTIATLTGITTVADFRRRDIACGGQGAPLAPAFHQAIFSTPTKTRVIVNIGGMSNITILNSDQPVIGFDTGPGNVLMDYWVNLHKQQPFDKDGQWASTGKVDAPLLQTMLEEPYFLTPAPKSTGRELFNSSWLNKLLINPSIAPEDIQATLLQLTVETIKIGILQHCNTEDFSVYLCGGGANNQRLLELLSKAMPHQHVGTTAELGIHPDWVEAIAFAWLAKQTMQRLPGNAPSVTGAKKAAILGGVYFAN